MTKVDVQGRTLYVVDQYGAIASVEVDHVGKVRDALSEYIAEHQYEYHGPSYTFWLGAEAEAFS